MYLSKLTLDPSHPQARRDLASAYEMHRTLARVYAPNEDAPPVRFLWRIEPSPNYAAVGSHVLVQSASPGNWNVIGSMPGYSLAMHTDKRVDLNALVTSGRQYQFRLRANPTVTREGKRYGLTAEGEQLAWLYRQGERLGFSVLTVERGTSERLSVRQNKAGRTIIVQAALFEGRLAATEPDRLRAALLGGIGHAKSLGLGLLSLAPRRA